MATNDPTPSPGVVPTIGMVRAAGPVLVRDILLPYVVYWVLHHQGVSNISALAAGGAVNVVFLLREFAVKRRLDVLGVVVLLTFALGIAASYGTGDARFALAQHSIITGGVGVLFLASLFAARPVMYLMIREMITHGDPAQVAEVETRWASSPQLRSSHRLMTAVWGAGLLVDALVRLVVISLVSVSTGAAASNALLIATFVLLIAWTRLYLPRRSHDEPTLQPRTEKASTAE